MDSIILNAPAKLNFSIDIVGVLPNGFHQMKMIMQTVDLFDVVQIERNNSKCITVTCKGIMLDSEKSNIAFKSAEKFFEAAQISEKGVAITIDKRIPAGSGMGGGSADGAAVLVGLNLLYNTGFSQSKLMKIGKKIGADIPFCIFGGTALVEGIGEKITKITDFPHCYFVVAKPTVSINTKAAFEAFDACEIIKRPDTDNLIAAIKWQDILTASSLFCNVFEQVIKIDEIDYIKEQMRLYGGLNPIMTGSGSAIYTVFSDEKRALDCYYHLCELAIGTYICEPIKTGPQVTTS